MINTVIIRIPDDEGVKSFVGLAYKDGVLESAGLPFTVDDDDDYNRLTHGHVVLAYYNEETESSLALATYEVNDEIYSMGWNNIKALVHKLISDHQTENKPH